MSLVRTVFGFSDTVSNIPLTVDSLASRLMYQVWSYPQEKVYVMTDRDAYTSGDTVRFRAWLVDAATHAKPQQASRFVYVELLNPFGNVEKRVKIRSNEEKFAGVLPLDEEMAEGTYTLCAYTQFMQNSGKDYFFRKTLPVFSQLSKKYRMETIFENGFLTTRLLEKNNGKEVRTEKISILGPDSTFFADKIRKRSRYSTNVSSKMRQAGIVKVKFDRYEKFVAIPYDTIAISLTFHPEGGYLIPNESNILAFKAIDKKGKSANFEGFIIDELGNHVAAIESSHRGMGKIDFTPQLGRAYRAVVDSVSFPLPSVDSDASVLNVSSISSDSIIVNIHGRYREGMSLIAHNGGVVTLALDINNPSVILERSQLGSGVVQLLLVDSYANILSSRLIFNHSGYMYNSKIDSIPEGDYTLRAFRNKVSDSSSSIVSNLLLQSELKGYIEDADYYFRNRNGETDAHLDLLMLTQGWERYDLPSSLKGNYGVAEVPLEIGGEITGTVKSRWRGKPLDGAIVMVIAPKMEYAAQSITDKDGKFVIDGFDWEEDTSFIIRVLSESGEREHNYTVDNDQFPDTDSIYTKADETKMSNNEDEQLLSLGAIMLEELEVTAPLSLDESRREMLSALGVKSVTSEEIDKMHATTYEEVIRKIPGLRIIDGEVRSARSAGAYNKGTFGTPVQFWIDGSKWESTGLTSSGALSNRLASSPEQWGAMMQQEHTYRTSNFSALSEFSASYPLHIIKTIEYYPPYTALVLSNTAGYNGGALMFTTKDASDIKDWDANLFIRNFKPIGYQNKPESYCPHYIYDPTSDDTVFNAAWLPFVKSIDEIPMQEDSVIQIEGISDAFMPVFVKKRQ